MLRQGVARCMCDMVEPIQVLLCCPSHGLGHEAGVVVRAHGVHFFRYLLRQPVVDYCPFDKHKVRAAAHVQLI